MPDRSSAVAQAHGTDRHGSRARGGDGTSSSPPTAAHLVVRSTSPGGTADEASLEALLALLPGPVGLVDGAPLAGQAPRRSTDRITVHRLPDLLREAGRTPRAATAAFADLLGGAASCTVLAPVTGAGAGGEHETVRAAELARDAAARGLDARLLGVSWHAGVTHAAAAALRTAVRAGVHVFAADDLSAIHAANDGVVGLRAGADPVFAVPDPAEAAGPRTGGIGVVDVRAPGAVGLEAVVDELRREDLRVLLLPHRWRRNSSDVAAAARLVERLGDPAVTAVVRQPHGAELRAVLGSARAVVASRAALAATALACGAPVLATGGGRDLEWLMRSAGQRARWVAPQRDAAAAVAGLLREESAVRRGIRAALPELAERALGAVPGATAEARP